MQVILLEKIQNLGDLGDHVEVKGGYGRNYLLPQRKAVAATADNIAKFEAQRADLEAAQAEVLARSQQRVDALAGAEVTIEARAGREGKLFGSISTGDIAEALQAAGFDVEKKEIRLPTGSLREIGNYELDVHLDVGVDAHITVHVVHEHAEADEFAEVGDADDALDAADTLEVPDAPDAADAPDD